MWYSFHKKVEHKINNMPEGSVFVPSDFTDIATDDTVSKILTRLTEKSFVKKVFRGVYWRPKKSQSGKTEDIPNPNNVALALARSNSQRVIPCGETALHVLGLTEETPSEWTYITDGAYHEYSYKNYYIKFKHAAGRFMNKMSDKTAIVVQAIKAYGKDKLTADVMKNILSKLSPEELKNLLEETKNTTSWICSAIKNLYRQNFSETDNA